jgi:hypothetical protein
MLWIYLIASFILPFALNFYIFYIANPELLQYEMAYAYMAGGAISATLFSWVPSWILGVGVLMAKKEEPKNWKYVAITVGVALPFLFVINIFA